jgi:hypothetical protein
MTIHISFCWGIGIYILFVGGYLYIGLPFTTIEIDFT